MTTRTFPRRSAALPMIVLVAAGTAACGGGGPGVSGPEAQTLFADYSATWILDADVSDSIPAPASRSGAAAGRGGSSGGGADPFGGSSARGGGGMPPGGMSGGRGGGGGRGVMRPGGGGGRGGMSPEAMEGLRHTMSAAGQRPTSVTLALNDSTFSVIQSPGGRASVPIMGDEVELSRTAWPVTAKVEWDDRLPRLKRKFENGGTIVDHFELVERDRLVVTRTIEGTPRGDVELRFVYDRETAQGDEPH